MKVFGLIGGLSYVSTVEYYRLINQKVHERTNGREYPRCIIYSLDFEQAKAFNRSRDWDGFLEVAADAGSKLVAAGAEFLAFCANTAHVVADELSQRTGVPVVHIGDATAAPMKAAGIRTAALLGTKSTMELDFLKQRLARYEISTLIPDAADREYINDIIFSELEKEIIRPETKARFVEIIDGLVRDGAEGVILGCTEIPLLIKQSDCNVPAFDTTELHADAIVSLALDGNPRV